MVKQARSLLGGEGILVANAPRGFDLAKSLRHADEVWIASAFVRKSGWELIRKPLLASGASLKLLCGLNFCQSEPWVLKDWNGSELVTRGAEAFVYNGTEMFHPKVFLVRQGRKW